jgi:hypothetical protein
VAFIAGIFTPWAFVVGAVLAFISLAGWFFSDPDHENKKVLARKEHETPTPQPLRAEEA